MSYGLSEDLFSFESIIRVHTFDSMNKQGNYCKQAKLHRVHYSPRHYGNQVHICNFFYSSYQSVKPETINPLAPNCYLFVVPFNAVIKEAITIFYSDIIVLLAYLINQLFGLIYKVYYG